MGNWQGKGGRGGETKSSQTEGEIKGRHRERDRLTNTVSFRNRQVTVKRRLVPTIAVFQRKRGSVSIWCGSHKNVKSPLKIKGSVHKIC
jgi:hypothetical protein